MKRLTSKNPLTENEAMNLSLTDLYMRLKVYEDAEAEGRLIVLPCKVGTPIYWINCNPYDDAWIEESTFALCDIYAFGKTVFLTREEAEAALRGGADG